jgi:alkylation response protein AidB-like acyl-CoA dehydrogenase
MSELRAILADTAAKVLSNVDDAAVREAGLLDVMKPEAEGGFGGGWEDAYVVLSALGAHAASDGFAAEIVAPKSGGIETMALARACQMAGAMQAALDLSVAYVRERKQFGKPLASFQAIQQQLALFAEESAAAAMAAQAACRAADRGPGVFEIGCAKLRANMAVSVATSVAHQVHGAMGFTAEYKLQGLTRLLWAWRSDAGNDRYWADRIGAMMAAQGADGFWPSLAGPLG